MIPRTPWACRAPGWESPELKRHKIYNFDMVLFFVLTLLRTNEVQATVGCYSGAFFFPVRYKIIGVFARANSFLPADIVFILSVLRSKVCLLI